MGANHLLHHRLTCSGRTQSESGQQSAASQCNMAMLPLRSHRRVGESTEPWPQAQRSPCVGTLSTKPALPSTTASVSRAQQRAPQQLHTACTAHPQPLSCGADLHISMCPDPIAPGDSFFVVVVTAVVFCCCSFLCFCFPFFIPGNIQHVLKKQCSQAPQLSC